MNPIRSSITTLADRCDELLLSSIFAMFQSKSGVHSSVLEFLLRVTARRSNASVGSGRRGLLETNGCIWLEVIDHDRWIVCAVELSRILTGCPGSESPGGTHWDTRITGHQ